jgi:hypothetical protein
MMPTAGGQLDSQTHIPTAAGSATTHTTSSIGVGRLRSHAHAASTKPGFPADCDQKPQPEDDEHRERPAGDEQVQAPCPPLGLRTGRSGVGR